MSGEQSERIVFAMLIGMALGWAQSGGHPFVAAAAALACALLVCLIAPEGAGDSDGP